ncbi:MAG: urate hydroxylase PuuD [Dehalococcoidia bacterium]|nr:urate hydroxylase PuuD [Dehalococcoidia bacterium]MDW8119055.1 hypothetical protein [Chloroflexota bacterium]
MDGREIFLLVVRWLHGLAAVAWIGGSLFAFVLLRGQGESPSTSLRQAIRHAFRQMLAPITAILALTGIVLTFERLTSPVASVPYVVVLALKVLIGLGMFVLARRWWRVAPSTQASTPVPRILAGLRGGTLLLLMGIVVYLLADLLKVLAEQALRGR